MPLSSIVSKTIECIRFDIDIIKLDYFTPTTVNCAQLIAPYVPLVTDRFDAFFSTTKDNEKLLDLLLSLQNFENELLNECSEMSSDTSEDLFSVAAFLSERDFGSSIYKLVNAIATDSLNRCKCLPITNRTSLHKLYKNSKLDIDNIVPCVKDLMSRFEKLSRLQIELAQIAINQLVQLQIVDFIIKHLNISSKHAELEDLWMANNTLSYAIEILERSGFTSENLLLVEQRLQNFLKVKLVLVSRFNTESPKYWFLYMNRVWYDLYNKFNFLNKKKVFFKYILTAMLQQMIFENYNEEDMNVFLLSVFHFYCFLSNSSNDFSDKSFAEINDNCWFMIAKFIKKLNASEGSDEFEGKSGKPISIIEEDSKNWMRFLNLNLLTNSLLNAKIAAEKIHFAVESTVNAAFATHCHILKLLLQGVGESDISQTIKAELGCKLFQLLFFYENKPDLFYSYLETELEIE